MTTPAKRAARGPARARSDLAGKVALVTGGASGIGRECARALARAGARVVVADLDERRGAAVVREVTRAGGRARFVRADVTRPADVQALVATTARHFGRLDFALNNAGIDGVRARTAEYPDDAWDNVIAVNLTGVFQCLKHELALMGRQRRGAIVNLASVAGLTGFVGHSAYTAAKHGVVGLTRTAALEYAGLGIRVNAICPSYTRTPMLERVARRIPGLQARLASIAPLGRLCTTEEIAQTALFLFSDAAAFITGQTVVMDGGILA